MHTRELLLALGFLYSLALCQKVFIDLVPEYKALQSCAEAPLSAIVRGMSNGCPDGGRMTSYSCFCTASSSSISAVISAAVVKNCNATEPASSADAVFASYCAVGTVTSQARPTTTTSGKDPGAASSIQATTKASASSGASATNTQSMASTPTTNSPPPASSSNDSILHFRLSITDLFIMALSATLAAWYGY